MAQIVNGNYILETLQSLYALGYYLSHFIDWLKEILGFKENGESMKKVFITGANRGIGLEFTKQLSAKGFEIYAVVRNSSDELTEIPNTHIFTGIDLENLDTITDFFSSHELPKFDWVILNAGILIETPLQDLDVSLIEKHFRVNTLAPLLIAQKLLPYLKEGTKVGLVSSSMGSIADNSSGGYYGYRMSKAALNMIGKNLAIDLKNKGVMVCLLHPGYVKTQMSDFMGNVPPESSVLGMIRIIEGLTLLASGSFYHYQGKPLPW